jgi:hypothetical protein
MILLSWIILETETHNVLIIIWGKTYLKVNQIVDHNLKVAIISWVPDQCWIALHHAQISSWRIILVIIHFILLICQHIYDLIPLWKIQKKKADTRNDQKRTLIVKLLVNNFLDSAGPPFPTRRFSFFQLFNKCLRRGEGEKWVSKRDSRELESESIYHSQRLNSGGDCLITGQFEMWSAFSNQRSYE